MILYIVVCLLPAARAGAQTPPLPDAVTAADSLGVAVLSADRACLACHPAAGAVLNGPMATREPERDFVRRAFGDEGEAFFSAACAGCHVTGCRDCHEDRGTDEAAATDCPQAGPRPRNEACLRCHRGYFTGWEYAGRAPREDHARYQRGPEADDEHYLKMLPDVHSEKGLGCTDCHLVHGSDPASGHGGGTVRTCRDCHRDIATDVPEHAITAHLEKMECWACHSAWAAQEYGTFLVYPLTDEQREAFAPLPRAGEWRRSAALRQQGPPPLGLNERGLVAPIRPEFILLVTDPRRGWENRLLTAEWKAFFPHTVRRGTVTCGGCHEAPRRFVLEDPRDRIYQLERDGLPLLSWWDQTGQRVSNGTFFTQERYDLMNRRTPEYVRQHLRLWQHLVQPDAPSSRP